MDFIRLSNFEGPLDLLLHLVKECNTDIFDINIVEITDKYLEYIRREESLNINVSSFDEEGFGELIYFFELACAVSAKLFGVNPFDQPGVEAYKLELHKLLN